MTRDQRQRIEVALAYPNEHRDVRVLVIEDNLVTYGSISTRIELYPDQLRPYKPTPKKSKPASWEPSSEVKEGVAVPPKKVASFGPLKKTKAASSSKMPAFPKSAVVPTLPTVEEAEEEVPSLEPLKRRRRLGTESESTPEIAPANPPSSGSEGVPTSRIGIAPEFENSQVLPDVFS